jgi:transcription elongation factor GreB
MNKAFTKETDEEEELPDAINSLPRGAKNYITPEGMDRLREELLYLRTKERPQVVETVSWAAGNGDRSENGDYIYGKKRLREIDRRMRFLSKRMEIAQVVDPAMQKNHDQVFFGATVTYADSKNVERKVRIVGVDEARLELNEISWISPVARALMKAWNGDVVKMNTPGGVEELEILKIEY